MTSPGNLDLEAALDRLPDEVANALEIWRIASLDREQMEAMMYAKFRGEDPKATATEIKARINSDPLRYDRVLSEIKAEANHTRLEQQLMAIKKRASLRVAF